MRIQAIGPAVFPLRMPAQWSVTLALFAALALTACSHKPPPPMDPKTQPVTPVLKLGSPVVTTLGALQGPYRLANKDSVANPTMLALADSKGTSVTFELAGLRSDEYPEPPDPQKVVTPAEIDAARERQQTLRAYTTKALADLLADKPLWVLRLSSDPTPLIYLFQPLSGGSTAAAPTGDANLVNALALRKGLALMELDGPQHPYQSMMLDNMTAAIIEAGRKAQEKDPPDIWNKFKLRLPPQVTPESMKAVGKRM